jgi:hypothetical protein
LSTCIEVVLMVVLTPYATSILVFFHILVRILMLSLKYVNLVLFFYLCVPLGGSYIIVAFIFLCLMKVFNNDSSQHLEKML